MDFKSYFELIRPLNCFMAGIAAVIGAIIAAGTQFNLIWVYAFLGAFLVCAGGQAVNDAMDVEIDKKINPSRPIPSGRITQKNALLFSSILFLLGLISAYLINFAALAIALIMVFLLMNYSYSMKKQKIWGNIVVSLGTAAPLIFGACINANYSIVSFFAVAAFFSNMARETIKDFNDLKGDEGIKKTIAMALPKKKLDKLVLFYCFLSVFFAGIVLAKKGILNNSLFLFFLFLAGTIQFVSATQFMKGKELQAQKTIKYAMIAALMAFLCYGVFG